MGAVVSRSDKYWAALGAAWVAAFLYGEGKAFREHNAQATLTYYYRARLGIEPATRWRWVGIGALWGFLGWAGAHLTWGVWGLRWTWQVKP